MQLFWHPAQRFERCRVAAWTCADHDGPWYELCHSGGQWFIQAMRGDPLKPTILHSRTWREDEAQRIWAALLFGAVR
ncbi:hypothetical protein [Herbidospora daliensis]|uniref:hypothetical protein n=1 Tax=Herbidospora daliensis TaxID=295585 RepID=UPI000783F288|nr:hypothetical protein [Herbidospora daliensis]